MKKTLLLYMVVASMLLCLLNASAQWTAPVNLSPNAVSALTNESMGSCIGVSGDTVNVVWVDRLSAKKGVIYFTQSIDTGLTWSVPKAISDTAGNAWNPAIAVNGQNIHVVWRTIDTANNAIRTSWYRHSLDGGITWGPVLYIDSTGDWPGVAVSGSHVYVANDRHVTVSNSEIFFLLSADNGMTWNPEQQLTFVDGRSEDEAIYALGSYVHMSWNDNRTGKFQIFYKESADYGVTWGPDVVADTAFDYSTMVYPDGPNVDVVAAGAPVGGHFQILLTQSSDTGATLQPSKDISNDTANAYYYPDMVRNGSDLHVVYGGTTGGWYVHSGDGGTTWSSPYFLATGNSFFIDYTSCALHVIYVNANHVYYLHNATGNGGASCNLSTGIKPLTAQDGLNVSLSPNPSSDQITLRISSFNKQDAMTVSILNVLGQEVSPPTPLPNLRGQIQRSGEIAVLGISNLPAGVYFIQVISQNAKWVGRFIKQ